MHPRTDQITSVISDIVNKNEGASIRRLSRLAYASRPDLFPGPESARRAIQYRMGSEGHVRTVSLREKSKVKVSKGSESTTYSMPKSRAQKWEPFEIDGSCRVAILSDLHIPEHDEDALAAAVEHCQSEGVDVLLLNGDVADASEFSRWAKSPKAVQTESSVEAVRKGLLWLCEQFPGRVIYKMGNHEEWLDTYCWRQAPELVGMPHITWEGILKIDQNLKPITDLDRVEFVKDQRPVMLGLLTVFHGHELPRGLVNAVNPARGAFLRMVDTVIIGHHHRSSSHVEYDWRHRPINCWSTGCLCDLTPAYARINKWNHGHAIVDVDRDGSFSVSNYKQIKGNRVVMA